MKQILVFILFAGLLCWFLFAPMYKHVLLIRHAVLQQEVDYLLEIGANGAHGYIDAAMMNESRNRLAERGFDTGLLQYDVSTTTGASGTSPGAPLMRGAGIRLSITYPYERLFLIDRLIGIAIPGETERMGASGMKMSEYVP
jgi:hypothetical protein